MTYGQYSQALPKKSVLHDVVRAAYLGTGRDEGPRPRATN